MFTGVDGDTGFAAESAAITELAGHAVDATVLTADDGIRRQSLIIHLIHITLLIS